MNYEIFCTWLSSGLDIARLKAKIGRLLSMVTARNGGKGGRSRGLAKRSKSPASWAVRGVFEAMDRKAEGVISQRDMKVYFLTDHTTRKYAYPSVSRMLCKTPNSSIEKHERFS